MRVLSLFGFPLFAACMAIGAPINGSLWNVTDAVAQSAIPANVPGTPPNVTFQVNSPLNFNNSGSVSAFLLSGGAFNIAGSAADLNRLVSDGTVSTLIQLTGVVTVTNGQQFTVTHDDGLTLIIGGLNVITASGPTPPIQTTATYTGPSGNFAFTLIYGECCSGSAVLQVNLPFQPDDPVLIPEPGSAALLTAGIIFVLFAGRRSKHAI